MLSVLMKLPFRSLTAMEDADLNQIIGGEDQGGAPPYRSLLTQHPLTEALVALTAVLFSIKTATTVAQ